VAQSTARTFTRDELADAFAKFERTVDDAARRHDWDAWVEHYTDDVLYIEHAAGTMHGRDEVRTWIRRGRPRARARVPRVPERSRSLAINDGRPGNPSAAAGRIPGVTIFRESTLDRGASDLYITSD